MKVKMKQKISLYVKRNLLLIILLVIFAMFSGFFIWASDAAKPGKDSEEAMKGTEMVDVIHNKLIKFIPVTPYQKGLILYPGGKVNPKAYSEIALAAAENGILTVIVPMPLNLAFFGSNKVDDVIGEFPEIEAWYLAGHSLGGAMGCQYVKNHEGVMEGLILLGAYPAGISDLSESDIDVISIYASEDGLSTVEKVNNAKAYLPDDTQYVLIEGGNHAQFGDYGKQNGDGEAKISRYEQMKRVIDEILKFIDL